MSILDFELVYSQNMHKIERILENVAISFTEALNLMVAIQFDQVQEGEGVC